MLETPRPSLRDYGIVTAAYWAFTLSDGALRMLVLLHFHTLGYSPFELSLLFLLYEALGVVTNLLGGWVGAKTGLNWTLIWGLALQIGALVMLGLLNPSWPIPVQVAYVIASQGASGIAKDLTKLSAKSAVKALVKDEGGRLFKWVAALTGSKNALKGVGFFLGSALLSTLGFELALYAMAAALLLALLGAKLGLRSDLGKAKRALPMSSLFNKTPAINRLAAARFFLFGARDVWFVVALPVFLHEVLAWSFVQVGTFMALWVIGYGLIQALAPRVLQSQPDKARQARNWAAGLSLVPLLIAAFVWYGWWPGAAVLIGLGLFGALFAVNSSLHSYLVLAYSDADKVTADVGFYYTANAAGRLLGCAVSGLSYQLGGLPLSLASATALLLGATACAATLPSVAHATRQIRLTAGD
jgi:hypothetical protein